MHGRELLIEQDTPEAEDGEPRGTEYAAVRTSRWKFVRYWDGRGRALRPPPRPLRARQPPADPAYDEVQQALAARLEKLRTCAGRSCRKKPALTMKLPPPVRKDGGRCRTAGDFVAKVRRPDGAGPGSRIVRVSFRVAGEPSGTVSEPPFNRKLNSRLLRSERKPLIEADAELLDGRILTLHDRVGICR